MYNIRGGIMPMKYKFNILAALKEKGYTTNKIRIEKIMSESTMQKFRTGEMVSTDNIARLCKLLDCQPGDILEYVPDENE
ncbi:MAG: helix-turn-helix domain-containing protein [Oscillospiraceae bacterium]|nr:helix-turn-helix domain-containing protein [Oscillospiraceae bacterium]